MDITLTLNGMDVSKRLATYQMSLEIGYSKVITTMDGVEHPYPGTKRPILAFSFLPMTEEESAEIYNTISGLVFDVRFVNTYTNKTETRRFRVVSNLESVFLLMSMDGKRRYNGGTIQLRAVGVL